jgi:hypothetical protein
MLSTILLKNQTVRSWLRIPKTTDAAATQITSKVKSQSFVDGFQQGRSIGAILKNSAKQEQSNMANPFGRKDARPLLNSSAEQKPERRAMSNEQ